MIPVAIGMIAAPKQKNSHVNSVKSYFSKVIERASEKHVAKNPKTTHKESALLIPLPL